MKKRKGPKGRVGKKRGPKKGSKQRKIWRVLPNENDVGWVLKWPDGHLQEYGDAPKEYVVAHGRICAMDEWLVKRAWSQLVVHKADGEFQYEHTYPRSSDPRRWKS